MVSVIVPNYNHAKFLAERLDSIVNQTYQDFELIILDDCSSDDSRIIIEKYRNHPKTSNVVYNDTNSGSTFKQWKKGITLAKGEYVWIAESDDFASLDFLEKMVPLIETNHAALIFSDSQFIDEQGDTLQMTWTKEDFTKGGAWTLFDGNTFLKKYMLKENSISNASAVVFNKTKALQVPNYENYTLCGDWLFWSTVIINSTVLFYNSKLNYFRQHSQKVTPKANLKGLFYIEGFDVVHYLLQLLNIRNSKRKHIGQSYWDRIKVDARIESAEIKKECQEKCKLVFNLSPIDLIFFPTDRVKQKMNWVSCRINTYGLFPALQYYCRKYITRRKTYACTKI